MCACFIIKNKLTNQIRQIRILRRNTSDESKKMRLKVHLEIFVSINCLRRSSAVCVCMSRNENSSKHPFLDTLPKCVLVESCPVIDLQTNRNREETKVDLY